MKEYKKDSFRENNREDNREGNRGNRGKSFRDDKNSLGRTSKSNEGGRPFREDKGSFTNERTNRSEGGNFRGKGRTYNREDKSLDSFKRGGKTFRDDKRGSFNDRDDSLSNDRENMVIGRNSVLEVLRSERTVEKIFVQKGSLEGNIKVIISIVREKGIPFSEVEKVALDDMAGSGSHQGVVALVSDFKYSSIEEIIDYSRSLNEDPFVIVLDEIEDPHNLGSIIRTADVIGAHGIIVPKRRSALITPVVSKVSAGAIEHMKVAKVTNLNQTLKELKNMGLWIIGADMDGDILYESNLKGPTALVVGNEGKGISRLVKENCDIIVRIPMKGSIDSLNASVAAGIVMYEIARQRGSIK